MPSDNSLICMRLNMAAGAVNCFFLEGLKSSAEISDTDVCDSAYSLKSLIQIFFFRFQNLFYYFTLQKSGTHVYCPIVTWQLNKWYATACNT